MNLDKIRKAIKAGKVEKASFLLSAGIHTLELVSVEEHTAGTGRSGIKVVAKSGKVQFSHYEYSEDRAAQIGLAFGGFEEGTQADFMVGTKEGRNGGVYNVIAFPV